MDIGGLTDEEISAISGRIVAPGIPPKSKAEAKVHIELIRKLFEHERVLLTTEARENRERREIHERCLTHWQEVVLPDLEHHLRSKVTVQLWAKYGIPSEVRGVAWCAIIGNERHIGSRLYEVCAKKAMNRDRSHGASASSGGGHSRSTTLGAGSTSDGRGSNEPDPGGQNQANARHVRHSHSLAAATNCRAMRDEDPSFFSPALSKLESMLAIEVDLPRTIISRSAAGAPGTPSSSSVSSQSPEGGSSPLSSPRRSSASRGGSAFDEAPRSVVPAAAPGATASSPCEYSASPVAAAEPNGEFGLAASHMLISTMCDEELLRRVRRALCTYVEYRPDIGYVQGMSYLAAMLLLHIHEDEQGFVAMANLLAMGHFRHFYSVHHRGMSVYIAAFEEVLRRSLPQLYSNFAVIGVHPQMYVMDWWMSLFSRALPFEIAVRCWDLYLLDEAYLFRITVGILVYFSPYIHEESALDEVMVFLSKVQRQHVDEKKFFHIVEDDDACGGTLSLIREVLKERLKDLDCGNDGPLEL